MGQDTLEIQAALADMRHRDSNPGTRRSDFLANPIGSQVLQAWLTQLKQSAFGLRDVFWVERPGDWK